VTDVDPIYVNKREHVDERDALLTS
jgi:hypothetical protein